MPVTLYKRQRQILDFISQYIQKNGYSPTLQQIAEALGVSSLATVHEHLSAMVKKKVIKKFEGAVRGIEIVDKKLSNFTNGIELPILGLIAAGSPIEPVPQSDLVDVPPSMLRGGDTFALRVKGESMKEDGILPGDLVIVRKQDHARNGQTVVALVNQEATIKTYFKKETHIELHPANAAMQPIIVGPNDHFHIEGLLIGVIRHCAI